MSCEKNLVSVLVRGALFPGVGEVEVEVGGLSTSVQLWELIFDDNLVAVLALLSSSLQSA